MMVILTSLSPHLSPRLSLPLPVSLSLSLSQDAFVEIYEQQRISHSWPYLKTVFGLAALGAAGVTIGALFIQK